jgi:hypothetical protein
MEMLEFLNVGYGFGSGSGDGSGFGSGDGSGFGFGYGSGSGDGSGFGFGYGSGSGSGSGFGFGYGSGSGSGSGYGYGDGYGFGSGSGDGFGYGDGSGSGYGSSSGSGVKSINKMKIYRIDGVDTIIKSLKKNIAKGFIVGNDLSLTPCFVVKSNDMFAHGKDLRSALSALQEKLFDGMDESDRIDAFIKEFNLKDKYKASKFFDWHNKLTGSCEMGRVAFCKNNSIDIDKDMFTVYEFVEKTKNDYGKEVIRELELKLKELSK